MASPNIKIKRSNVAGKVPHYPTTLDVGEFAINTADGKVFIAAGVGVGTTVREVGISTTQILSSGIGTFANIQTTNLTVTTPGNIISGISSGSSKVETAIDSGNQWHHVAFLDKQTGYQKIKSNGLTYNPSSGRFYSGIGSFGSVVVNGHSELDNVKSVGIATFSGNSIHGDIYSTGISTISGFRFPSDDGSEDQALVTDGNGSLSFKTLSGGGGATGAATTISAGVTTCTQGQTAFTTVHPWYDGTDTRSVQVFLNGLKMRPSGAGNATKDFTASSNSTVTLEEGANVGDEVRTVVYYNHTIEEEYFTATEGQTLFTLTGSSAAQKYFRVYVNGTKLRNGTDYGVAAPVTLVAPCATGDHVEIVSDDAEDAFTATDQQVNFTPTATTITEDNMQVFINGVQQTPTVDYSIGDPAVTFADAVAANVGDQIDVCIRRT